MSLQVQHQICSVTVLFSSKDVHGEKSLMPTTTENPELCSGGSRFAEVVSLGMGVGKWAGRFGHQFVGWGWC